MKTVKFLPLLFLFIFASCSSVRVASDFDKEVDFNQYQTFAFYKPGIDKAKINDLDKRRILRAIEFNLSQKGMRKSENPDLIISIFTKEKERVDVYNNYYGYGWYWHPWYYQNPSVHRTAEGTLFIDLIDAKSNNLVWQGMGTADLRISNMDAKEKRINEIVREIMAKYPPQRKK